MNKFKIWGLQIEEILVDDKVFWKTDVRNPFKLDDKWQVGLNEKFFRECWRNGVDKIILQIGEREIMMEVPSSKSLKKKVKAGEYEDKPSLFKGSAPMRIYHFKVI